MGQIKEHTAGKDQLFVEIRKSVHFAGKISPRGNCDFDFVVSSTHKYPFNPLTADKYIYILFQIHICEEILL